MGSAEEDIAVIKNDVSHIKDGIDDIKAAFAQQNEECERKFCELYDKSHATDLKVQDLDGATKTHSRYFGYVAMAIIAVIGWLGDVIGWLRGTT